MAKLLKLRRGTTTQHGSFTGAEGEVTIDTTKDTAVVHDGAQAGGRPLAREDMTNVSSTTIAGRLDNDSIAVSKIAAGTLPSDVKIQDANVSGNLTIESADIVDGTIVNADVNASAAIAGTKISPDFGSQNIATTGTLGSGAISTTGLFTISSGTPTIRLADTNPSNQAAYDIKNTNSTLRITDSTNSVDRLVISGSGELNVSGNANFSSGIDVTGDITATQGNIITNYSFYLNQPDGSIFFGSNTGGYGDNAGIGIASGNNYHITGSGQGDLVVSAKSGKRIVFGTKPSGSGATDKRAVIKSDGTFDITGNLDVGAGVDVTGNITATGTVDGRDVAADGTKLDGIESGATADQSASEILTLLKTVDGTGSGLSADNVDGIVASQFLRSDTTDTASGDITFSGGGGAISIAGGSDIRFVSTGSWTGEATKIQHHNNLLYIQGGSSGHNFRNSGGSTMATLDNSGNFVAVGNVTAYSDARLKTNVNTINDALSIVGKLRGVSFDWKESGKHSIGVIAQEVEEIIPEVVLTNVNTDPATGTEVEVKSVDYGKIVGVLINAINELKAEVDELKGGK